MIQFVTMAGSKFSVPRKKILEWKSTFSILDIDSQLAYAAQWLIDNPESRKPPSQMIHFLGGWLQRAAQKAQQATATYKPYRLTDKTTRYEMARAAIVGELRQRGGWDGEESTIAEFAAKMGGDR